MTVDATQHKKSCMQCFKVLGEDTRVQIVRMMQRGEAKNVGAITRSLGVTQPTVSHHLQLLAAIGVLVKERRGREVLYAFNKEYPCRKCGVFSAPIRL